MIRLVVEAGYEDYLKETHANYRTRLEDLEQLAIFARQFATTAEFLAQLALLTNVEAEADRPVAKDNEQTAALDDSPGEGPGVRRGVCDHALRRIVSLGAFARHAGRRGGGAAIVLRSDHTRAQRALSLPPARSATWRARAATRCSNRRGS